MNREQAVEVVATFPGVGPSKGIMTAIDATEHPTFLPRRVLAFAKGPEILTIIQELRHSLKPHEPRVFTWLKASPGNPEEYARDPLGSLAKMGIRLDQETREKLNQLGRLLQQASETVNQREG